jgi:predicted phosphodiesterase
MRFVVLGDSGTGEGAQFQVAAAIGKVCGERGCDFMVHTGDALYETGAESADDPQFAEKFEAPYGRLGIPAYVVLGNHDVGGDPTSTDDLGKWSEVGDREVAYAHRGDRGSAAWQMPARWYAVQKGGVAFAAFDTSAFVFAPLESDPHGPLHAAEAAQAAFAATAWPANATWRFAVGHHPFVSNGMHGDAGSFDRDPGDTGAVLAGGDLRSFYLAHVCGTADVLLTGHDHDLQWLDPVAACGGTRFLVSGAAARPRALADAGRHPAAFQRGATLGFWWLEAQGNTLRLAAFDGEGTELYHGTVLKAGPASGGPSSSSGSPTRSA